MPHKIDEARRIINDLNKTLENDPNMDNPMNQHSKKISDAFSAILEAIDELNEKIATNNASQKPRKK